jgi:hypothetical protein
VKMVPTHHHESGRRPGDSGITVSPNTVGRLLRQMSYTLRVNRKQLTTDQSGSQPQFL